MRFRTRCEEKEFMKREIVIIAAIASQHKPPIAPVHFHTDRPGAFAFCRETEIQPPAFQL